MGGGRAAVMRSPSSHGSMPLSLAIAAKSLLHSGELDSRLVMVHPHAKLLEDLLRFVRDEQAETERKLREVWSRPIQDKLEAGWAQALTRLERGDDGRSFQPLGLRWRWSFSISRG